MRVSYSSAYISVMGLPTKLKALLRACYHLSQLGFSRSGLTREEWAALMDFVQSYPKSLLDELSEKKEER